MPKKNKTSKKQEKADENTKVLIENFVNLQKVLTNLAVKFDDLSDNISKLLQLFEISAKSFAEKQSTKTPLEQMERQRNLRDREFAEKIDRLLDQNKVIAKGITLLEEKVRENSIPKPASSLDEKDSPIKSGFNPRHLPKI